MSILHGDLSLFWRLSCYMINPIKPNIGLWISLNMNWRYYSLETPKCHCRCNHTRVLLCRKFCANAPLKVLICWKSGQYPWKSAQNLWKSGQKRRPTLFHFIKWRPTFAEKHTKTFFGDHPKKVFMIFEGKKIVGKVAQNVSGKFGKIRAKSFAPQKICLILHLWC